MKKKNGVIGKAAGMVLAMTIICGVLYTIAVTGISQLFFHDKANGSVIEIDGKKYRDGGLLDNEPIQPLYDLGIRQFIVIGMRAGKVLNTDKWPDAQFITIYPSHDLGDLIDGTLNFTERAKEFRQMLGEKDALRSLKTKFQPDDLYIRMEPVLAQNDYNDIMMQLRVNHTYKTMENRVNSNIEKFNNIAKKYENL